MENTVEYNENKKLFLNSISNIKKKNDGSFIVNYNNMPYHISNSDEMLEKYNWLTEYAKENPNKINYYIEHQEPTEEEMLAEITEEERANYHRAKRDSLINKEIWKLQRHEQEKALSLPTTLTDEQYLTILQYIQLLRDIPQQEGFPNTVVYPELPE